MTLVLNVEQATRLQAVQAERDRRQLAQVLVAAFPALAERVGDRLGALVAHGEQRAAAHGLTHALAVARYLACWVVLGTEFESRGGHTWALDLLGDRRRQEGAKAFQLVRRCREELQRLLAAGGPAAADLPKLPDFDRAIALLDDALRQLGVMGSLQRGQRLVLGQPCDIDAVELREHEPPPRQPYRFERGQWSRAGGDSAPPAPLVVTAADAAAWPSRISLLGQDPAGRPARLRLRLRAGHCCDPAVHPAVLQFTETGLLEWRGPHTTELVLTQHASATELPPTQTWQPALAWSGGARFGRLQLASCGLREQGDALGDLATDWCVYPAAQHWMLWRREAAPDRQWSTDAAPAPHAPRAACIIERDGQRLDAGAWQAGLQALDAQLEQGLERLFTAWCREAGFEQPQMAAEPALLCGDAGLAWGWQPAAEGLAGTPSHRVAAHLDLIAARLSLRLSGQLALHGSLSQWRLHCAGQIPLQLQWDTSARDGQEALPPAGAQVAILLPLTLQVDVAAAESACMVDASLVAGAVVGRCGLRPRADGLGWQWFAQLAVEPVQALCRISDPLLGHLQWRRSLLPAMTLVDWSLG
ncbi:hypothetical protein KAK07_23160 [Ideonella sp. 4Y16]|uniref:Uncharacterized protein n=1 Tax=Ideonella alba TaxID=2824118 RepID=A0A940YD05_9BURK|nr:hypothetical protein [Ideonella alba]MBQ0930387.1 hypothetical protein [Ideonella alba]MBQ0946258.1 hypothetical protein [Ideonella alba]